MLTPHIPLSVSERELGAPKLVVIVDTEEEFDWSAPFSRDTTAVTHIKAQEPAQQIFARFGLTPAYVVDYPVASQEAGFRPLREWLEAGRCEIGAHLHPWVNPPFEETVSRRNSYAGNLPPALEREKLRILTETIAANFGRRPTLFRAGRYGIGAATGGILEEMGYLVDSSIVPRTDFRDDEGPDFTEFNRRPFWFGTTNRILELPLTGAWCGELRHRGRQIEPMRNSSLGRRIHLSGILARLGLFERIRLTPEGIDLPALKRLTKTLLQAGTRCFGLSYHSPSLVPGHTPYVRDGGELAEFLRRIEAYCEFFFTECGGTPSTPDELRALLLQAERRGPDPQPETAAATA